MSGEKPEDLIDWLHRHYGGAWDKKTLTGPFTIAAGLNAKVRKAASTLPFEREPGQFELLYANLAKDRGGND